MADRPFPLNFANLRPDARPRRFLALPPDFEAAAEPDAQSPVFSVAPDAVLDAFIACGLADARTRVVRREAGQVELVQRSLVFRFPDYVTAEAFAVEPGAAALAIYSRAVVGYSDLGVNRKRVLRWLEATAKRLGD